MSTAERALELASELGFDLAGLAPLAPPPDAQRFGDWLDAGHHGALDYLERHRARIEDPRDNDPSGKTLLVVGLAHSRPRFELSDGTRVARYAAGRDYHNIVGKRLQRLARALRREGHAAGRSMVDASPLLERSHAAQSGVGVPSKAANLLHPDFGPWFFLGELILEIEPPAPPPAPASAGFELCGTCTACIDACPTGAIVAPGLVHAPDCISYQTIENRGPIPAALRPQLGPWAFGCDVCSEVCPIGSDTPDLSERFGVHPALEDHDVASWLEISPEEGAFAQALQGSPLRRPKRAGLARNAAIVLGNRPSERGLATLLNALSCDPSSMVREASAWALAHGYREDRGVLAALEAALGREPDPVAQAEMARHMA